MEPNAINVLLVRNGQTALWHNFAWAGTGRDFVTGYLSLYYMYPWVPVTIAFWACPQLENIHLNKNNK